MVPSRAENEKAKRALAVYREARNAQQNFMISYAVLNYYKVVEIGHKGRGDVKNWFRDTHTHSRCDANFRPTLHLVDVRCLRPHVFGRMSLR
jgi:hypothetical protein